MKGARLPARVVHPSPPGSPRRQLPRASCGSSRRPRPGRSVGGGARVWSDVLQRTPRASDAGVVPLVPQLPRQDRLWTRSARRELPQLAPRASWYIQAGIDRWLRNMVSAVGWQTGSAEAKGSRSAAMIDLHCHMLPGIDDGAGDLPWPWLMAQAAVADGIRVTACTPAHLSRFCTRTTPPASAAPSPRCATELARRGHPARPGPGRRRAPGAGGPGRSAPGRIPTQRHARPAAGAALHGAPPRFEDAVFALAAAGYAGHHPPGTAELDREPLRGVRAPGPTRGMQVTAGSVTGRFGRRPRYWAERLLDEGWVHILATDAHGVASGRPGGGARACGAARGAEARRWCRNGPRV